MKTICKSRLLKLSLIMAMAKDMIKILFYYSLVNGRKNKKWYTKKHLKACLFRHFVIKLRFTLIN